MVDKADIFFGQEIKTVNKMVNIDKFRNISFKKRTHCMVCGAKSSLLLIDLPRFPLTEIYVKKPVTESLGFVDQEFCFCQKCGHGQIMNIIDPKVVYGDNYATRTSISSSAMTALDIFLDFINSVVPKNQFKRVMDIGCNDLYTLKNLRNYAEKLYGVDPIWKGKTADFKDDKINVIGDFVENLDFKNIDLDDSLVVSSHTLEHIEDPKKLIKLLINKAHKDTLFVFQFPGLEYLVKTAHFDQIFHQHLNYFTLHSVLYMLEEVGAELISFKENPWHWGALMIAFKKSKKNNKIAHENFRKIADNLSAKEIKAQYNLFKAAMKEANKRILSLKNEQIYGFGAALMLPVQHYYIKSLSKLKNIIDDDQNKDGLYYLNFPVQITNSKKIKDLKNSVVFTTAINSKQPLRGILARLFQLNVKEIIVPTNIF